MPTVVRLLATLSLLVAVSGCSPPSRIAKDGYTLVPLEGLGSGLPREGSVQTDGKSSIDVDSLYVRTCVGRLSQEEYLEYLRFWPTGQVLMRYKPKTAREQVHVFPLITARDGDVDGDWLAGPPLPHSAAVGTVGRYVVVGTEVYIELFHSLTGGPNFVDCAGHVTPDGFTLDRIRYRNTPFPRWKPMADPWRFVRYPVGEMRGTPTW